MARGEFLTAEERERIMLGINNGESGRQIARELGKHHSTVGEEIKKNGGRECYSAARAQERSAKCLARPKGRKLETCRRLHDAVNEGLAQKWSPQQISRRLEMDYPDDTEMRVSCETIYESLYLQARGELRTQLKLALRTGRARRVPRSRAQRPPGQIQGMVNISERPPEHSDRAVPGNLEGDLIVGKGNKSQIATLVDRKSRFTVLVKIPYDRTADRVARLLARKMESLPEFLKKSVTWDQGKEMARHADFTVKSGIPVYFCDPHSPWQRGTNENTNGLLRQYFPKGTDLSLHTQAELDIVAMELNNRPRKTLGWKTPAEVYQEMLEKACVGLTA